jgi:beta-lactamase regulating signal transducer with metallopeptidase domain
VEPKSASDEALTEPQGDHLLAMQLAEVQDGRTPSQAQVVALVVERLFTPTLWNLSVKGRVLGNVSVLLLCLWVIISGLRLYVFFSRLSAIRELKRASLPASPNSIVYSKGCAHDWTPKRSVQLKISPTQRSPMVLGFRKPVILLPASDYGQAVEPILRHELAHVRRYDDWSTLVQHFHQSVALFSSSHLLDWTQIIVGT